MVKLGLCWITEAKADFESWKIYKVLFVGSAVRRLKPKGNYQKASELGDYFWICHSLGGWVKTWFEWSEHKKPQCGAWYPWHPRLLQSWSYTRCQAARRADATCHYYSEPYKHWVRLIRLIWKLKSSLNQGLSLILEVNRLVELGRE